MHLCNIRVVPAWGGVQVASNEQVVRGISVQSVCFFLRICIKGMCACMSAFIGRNAHTHRHVCRGVGYVYLTGLIKRVAFAR